MTALSIKGSSDEEPPIPSFKPSSGPMAPPTLMAKYLALNTSVRRSSVVTSASKALAVGSNRLRNSPFRPLSTKKSHVASAKAKPIKTRLHRAIEAIITGYRPIRSDRAPPANPPNVPTNKLTAKIAPMVAGSIPLMLPR
ncbi:hypothetical protein D3C75_915260 [compost metagenome]